MSSDVKISSIGTHTNISLIAIRGSLDTMFAYKFEEEVDALINEGQRKYVIDLAEVEYISSAGIGVLSAFILRLQRQQGVVRFINLPENVDEILHLTHLIRIFTISESQEHALREIETPA